MNNSTHHRDIAHKPHLGTQALVIGASMAGLVAARVLSDYFDKVTLIERDTLPQESVVRNGVPQGRHSHVLLIRGQQSLERFFPDFVNHLDKAGSPRMRWMDDVRLYLSNGWITRNPLNITTRTTTRPNLEWIVRQELLKLPNIAFIENCQVNALLCDDSKARVVGLDVTYRRGAGDNANQSDILPADMIVDASGRNSKLPEWLQTLGYEAPQETHVNSRLGYASCLYSSLSYVPDWKLIGINAKPPDQPRGGTITLQEGGQWMVTLMGYGRDAQPATDLEGFLAFAKSLPSPEIYEALKGGTLSSEISGYANTMNVWHHYEKLKRFPTGLAVLGDAACCFNPVYAQGMTTGALAAETLDNCLSKIVSLDALGMRFQTQLSKVIANPWLLATGSDFQFPETEGKRPSGFSGLAQGYFERLLQIMHDDSEVASAFIKVINMVNPPLSLFSPKLIIKVLTHRSKPKIASKVSEAAPGFNS